MPSIKQFLCAAILALAVAVPAARAQAPLQTTPIPMWVPNANVADVARVGNTLVVGGVFDHVGPPTGAFAVADAGDATALNTAAAVVGQVNDVVPDGAGGWYVAASEGDGTLASTVLHVGPSGQRDPAFVSPVTSSNGVYISLAFDAGRLFVAGSFSSLAGQARGGLAELDAATGAVRPWAPIGLASGSGVFDVIATQGVVYASTSTGGSSITGLAYDAATGANVAFPALQSGGPRAVVGDRVYIVTTTSTTDTISAYTRAGVAVATWTNRVYDGIKGVAATATQVYAVVETDGSPSSAALVALDANTGITVWTSPSARMMSEVAIDGATLVAGGSFQQVGASARTNLAAFDTSTGAVLPWAPVVGGAVIDVAVSGGAVAFGGGFASVGGVNKRGLVALDLATGRPAAVQPPDVDSITALAASGDLVVAARGGGFGIPKEVFAYSASTGQTYPKVLALDAEVNSMTIAGPTLFLGGFFSSVDGQPRRFLAAYDLANGAVLPWNPSPDNVVHKLRVNAGTLYVGGRFLALSGAGRGRTAAFDLNTLQLTPSNPQHGNEDVSGLEVYQDRVLLGGTRNEILPGPPFFRTIARTVSVDRASGALLSIDVPLGPNLALVAGTLVVAGNGQPAFQQLLATFDAVTGQLLPWPVSVATSGSSALGDSLLFGFADGLVLTRFLSIGGLPIRELAVFRPQVILPGAPRQIQMTVTGSTVSLAWSPGPSPAPLAYVIEAGSAPGLSDLGRFPVGLATQVAAVVAPGSYALRVRAVGASGEGPPSSEWLFTTPAIAAPPAAPSGLVGTVVGNVVSLGWTAAAGNATTYVIEGGTGPGLSNLGVLATGSLDTAIAGAVPAGTYYFRMRAANAFGASAPSNEIVLVVP